MSAASQQPPSPPPACSCSSPTPPFSPSRHSLFFYFVVFFSPHEGHGGNCELIASLAAMAEFPRRIRRLCRQRHLSVEGKYVLSVYPNIQIFKSSNLSLFYKHAIVL